MRQQQRVVFSVPKIAARDLICSSAQPATYVVVGRLAAAAATAASVAFHTRLVRARRTSLSLLPPSTPLDPAHAVVFLSPQARPDPSTKQQILGTAAFTHRRFSLLLPTYKTYSKAKLVRI